MAKAIASSVEVSASIAITSVRGIVTLATVRSAEADHALQHELLLIVQLARLGAGLHHQPQLVGAEVTVLAGGAVHAQQPRDEPAALVEHVDDGPEYRAEQPQRPRHHDRRLLRVLKRNALRRQLAGDHVEGR